MLKLSLAILLAVALVHSAPTVNNSLLRTLQTKGTANIVIILNTGSTTQILQTLKHKTFTNRDDRLTTVANTLKAANAKNQADLLNFLSQEVSPNAVVKPFWITNKVFVRNADLTLVQKLSGRSDIQEIREEIVIPLEQPIDLQVNPVNTRAGEQWGVATIQAPHAWDLGFNGQGIVVSNIDTGVRGTHEALAGNHRADHGWFDPEFESESANDPGGHGTHTMGTIAGTTNGVGVAPGAQWIACIGCGAFSCSEFQLVSCGEFVACPTNADGTNADCTKAPHLVSNSWGGGQGNDFYDDVVSVWREDEIVPLFSQGNSGPSCGSANSPGDSALVIGVGSTVEGDTLSSFSSVGPAIIGDRIKPDIAAPGSNVYSSYNTDDGSYAFMSGTSMACPHAAGLTALLLSKDKNLTINQVLQALQDGAQHVRETGNDCGGLDDAVRPNYNVGAGRVDAKGSFETLNKF